MHWTVSGVNQGGCTLSGSGSKAVDEDNTKPGITLEYGNARYLGTETLDQAFFTIFFTGGGGFPCSGMDQGPKNLDFLQINRHDLVFAQNELKGRYDFGGAEGAAWKWDFK